jgi:hypothetical protein
LVLIVPSIWATGALAQQPTPTEVAAARQLFQEGLSAAREGSWQEAREAFQRSYDLAPRSNTLLNLAGAQTETGHLVAATESYRRFISDATGDGTDGYRAQAEQALGRLETRLCHVHLEIDGLQTGDQLQLDGADLSRATIGVWLPVDPGSHDVVVLRDGDEVARTDFTLEEGVRREVTFEVTDDRTDTFDDVFTSVWFWIGVGVLTAAVATTVIVLAFDEDEYTGNLGPGMVMFE